MVTGGSLGGAAPLEARKANKDGLCDLTRSRRPKVGLQEAARPARPAQPPNPSPLCLAAFPNLFNKSSRRRPAAVMCDRRSGLTTTDPRLEFSWHRCGSQGQGVLHSLILALHNRQASFPQISRGGSRRSPRSTLQRKRRRGAGSTAHMWTASPPLLNRRT